MLSLFDLWLPILAAAVLVFLVSSVLHMVIPIHRNDYKKIAGEDAVRAAMREHGVTPGLYSMPHASSTKEMCAPEMVEKYGQGPVACVTVMPNGTPAMGKSLVLWFLYAVVVSVLAAYVAAIGVPAGASAMTVFRITSAAAILGYAVGHLHDSTWKGQPWGTTLKYIVDGVVYGLVTAGAFAWLWPDG